MKLKHYRNGRDNVELALRRSYNDEFRVFVKILNIYARLRKNGNKFNKRTRFVTEANENRKRSKNDRRRLNRKGIFFVRVTRLRVNTKFSRYVRGTELSKSCRDFKMISVIVEFVTLGINRCRFGHPFATNFRIRLPAATDFFPIFVWRAPAGRKTVPLLFVKK